MTVVTKFAPILRAWRTILVCVLVGLCAGGICALLIPPSYRATCSALVSVDSTTGAEQLYQAATFSEDIAQTYAALAATPFILAPSLQKAGVRRNIFRLSTDVVARVEPDSAVISLTVTDRDPRTAVKIANAIVSQLNAATEQLAPGATDASSLMRIISIQPATKSAVAGIGGLSLLVLFGVAGVIVALLTTVFRGLTGPERIEVVPSSVK